MRKFILVFMVALMSQIIKAEVTIIDTIFLRPRAGNGVSPRAIGVNPTTNRVYVANYETKNISVINSETDSVVVVIPLINRPHEIEINHITNRIYVTHSFFNDTVSVIDGSTNSIITYIPVGEVPFGIGINTDSNKIYIANYKSNTISVIDGLNNSVIATIPVDSSPYGIGVNLEYNKIYVTHCFDNTVLVIDGFTNSIIDTILVGAKAFPRDVEINSSNNKVYITNKDSVFVIDSATDSVIAIIPISDVGDIEVNSSSNKIYVTKRDSIVIINSLTDSLITTIPVDGGLGDVGINIENNKIYVAKSPNNVLVIDGSIDLVINNILLGTNEITGICINYTTDKIYIADRLCNNVFVVDAITHSLITTIPVGREPTGIGINIDKNKIYVANSLDKSITVIDGIGDTVIKEIKDIFNYHWPWDVEVSTVYNTVYVTGISPHSPGSLAVINGLNDSVIAKAQMSGYGVAIMEVADRGIVGGEANKLWVINGFTGAVEDTIPSCGTPFLPPLSIEYDGINTIYFTQGILWLYSDSVVAIDISRDSVKAIIPVGESIWAIGVNATLNRVYVASIPQLNDSIANVSIIDTEADSVIQTIPIPSGAYWMDVNIRTNRFYVSCYTDGTVLVFQDDVGAEEKSDIKIQTAKLEIHPSLVVKSATISYQIPKKSKVSLKIYDIGGRIVEILVNEEKEAGNYKVKWNISDKCKMPNGIYFVKFVVDDHKETKKMIRIK